MKHTVHLSEFATDQPRWDRGVVLQWLAAVIASAILLAPFFAGFHQTADQKEYALTGMTTPISAWLEHAWPVATKQGRIGHFLAVPLEYSAGLIGDMWFFSFLCVGILLTIAFSAFAWLTTLSGSRSPLAPMLLYLGLLTAGGLHWLPSAYPMSALPLATGLAAKAIMIRYSDRWQSTAPFALCALLIASGAVTYELDLAFFTVMFATEIVCRFFSTEGSSRLSSRYLMWNAVALVAAIAAWGSFRFYFGSEYDGNQFPSQPFNLATIEVVGRHLLSAPMSPHFWPAEFIQRVSPQTLLASLVLLVSLAFALYRASWATRPWWWIGFGVALAVGVTIPIAIEPKFQEWCLVNKDCTYIDSRLSLIGIVATGVGVISLLPRRATVRLLLTAVISIGATSTFLANADTFAARSATVQGRELLAKRYVCGDRTLGDTADEVATHLANDPLVHDPNAFVFDADGRKNYWMVYIDHLQNSRFWLCP